MNNMKKNCMAKKCLKSLRMGNGVVAHRTVSEGTITKINESYLSAYLSESREIERMTAAFFYRDKK